MFEYEKCIQEVKEAGIEFTEAEKMSKTPKSIDTMAYFEVLWSQA